MEPESLLLYSQQPATCMCPKFYESSRHYLSCFFKIRFNIILPYAWVVQGFLIELMYELFFNFHMLYALSIIFSSIWSTLIINGEEYESLSSFLCYFVQISLSTFLLGSHLPHHPVLEHLERTHM